MADLMADFLMRSYGLSRDTARELVAEPEDTTSLECLADYRAARAVNASPTAQSLMSCPG